mmetsp:Transcript_126253/g.363155  ORF Transcript_126253/g.363155 Transcript_126253/m.363155 type:complete len:209 (-) Transcript_126253:203-829(-)
MVCASDSSFSRWPLSSRSISSSSSRPLSCSSAPNFSTSLGTWIRTRDGLGPGRVATGAPSINFALHRAARTGLGGVSAKTSFHRRGCACVAGTESWASRRSCGCSSTWSWFNCASSGSARPASGTSGTAVTSGGPGLPSVSSPRSPCPRPPSSAIGALLCLLRSEIKLLCSNMKDSRWDSFLGSFTNGIHDDLLSMLASSSMSEPLLS